MVRKVLATVAVLAGVSAAWAVPPTLSVTTFDTGNPAIYVVDVSVTIDTGVGDSWTAAGISTVALSGATFRYRFADEVDPNQPHVPLFTNVEPDNVLRDRFVSFVSTSAGQTVGARFRAGEAAQIAGGYEPPTPTPSGTPTFFNVAFFDDVPPGEEGSGFITRVAIDVPALYQGTLYLSTTGPQEPGDVRLIGGPADTAGEAQSATASFQHPSPLVLLDWGVWSTIPEPASLALLLLGGLMGLRRR